MRNLGRARFRAVERRRHGKLAGDFWVYAHEVGRGRGVDVFSAASRCPSSADVLNWSRTIKYVTLVAMNWNRQKRARVSSYPGNSDSQKHIGKCGRETKKWEGGRDSISRIDWKMKVLATNLWINQWNSESADNPCELIEISVNRSKTRKSIDVFVNW